MVLVCDKFSLSGLLDFQVENEREVTFTHQEFSTAGFPRNE